MRVLLVEDELIIAMLLKMDLKSAGLDDVKHVSSGPAALREVELRVPDAIIMDINLGAGIDGIETARLIMESRPVPLLFMTGYDDPSIRARAEALKPLGYVTKPVTPGKIAGILKDKFSRS